MKNHSKLKKIILCIVAALCILFVLATILYINLKNLTVKKIQTTCGQEIYLMGTFHTDHFDSMNNYSIEEMLSAVKNINPDVVFIEAREENFEQYGVVDGPVDMCITYCYCKENDIPVEMVDFWKVTNETYKQNTTTDDRDNNIHQKVMEKLKLYENKKILVVCGFGHLYPQYNRLREEGFKKGKVGHLSKLFKNKEGSFKYPSGICDIWEKRTEFYTHTFPESIQSDPTLNAEVKARWPVHTDNSFYNSQMKYCELFRSNRLYR